MVVGALSGDGVLYFIHQKIEHKVCQKIQTRAGSFVYFRIPPFLPPRCACIYILSIFISFFVLVRPHTIGCGNVHVFSGFGLM